MGIHSERPESDDEIIAIVLRSDTKAARAAFSDLYQRHARLLLAFLRVHAIGLDADDVHQEVWLRVWERLPSAYRPGNFRAWLHTIARNYVQDLRRKRKPDSLGDRDAEMLSKTPQTLEQIVENERRQALANCLERLKKTDADLVRSRLAGESYEEICPRLGLDPARAHSLFHAAKTQLQDCVSRALS